MRLRRTALLLILLVGATAGALAGEDETAQPGDPPTAVILTYHVVHSPTDSFYSMTREAFREQMNYLLSTGYTVIPLEHLVEYASGRRESIPQQSVVITVDDGWKCTYTEIYPLMTELGFPFTVFIYPDFIGKSYYALQWPQIREMADAGVDIQSHTTTHPFLTKQDDAALEKELAGSRALLEKKVGKPIRYVAYPYGDYDGRVAEATQAAGYDAGLTCNFGEVRAGSDPFRMNRVVIYKETSFASFRKLLGASELELADAMPAPSGTLDPHRPVIAARIAGFEGLDPESVQLALLGIGRLPYSYDPRDGSISLVLREPLEEGTYSAAVWGTDRETGERRDAVWSFRLPEPMQSSGRVASTPRGGTAEAPPPSGSAVRGRSSHQK
ncbi:MAG TPA: polysaccharide deacetylase family protein [Thermoanaerobaculia bacterium]|nr:polysaccharide deacetylase family protein [Thermoanaerobaculia bacterium]